MPTNLAESELEPPRCRHNSEVGIMHPTTLFTSVWEHLAECAPETERAIADGQHRRAHATAFEIAQLLGPRLRGLPIAVADRYQLLAAIGAHTYKHQAAQPLVFQTNVEMDSVGPQVHVVDLAQVALLERCQLLAPLAREPLDRGRAQASFAAKELG